MAGLARKRGNLQKTGDFFQLEVKEEERENVL
jgi:hypothetical protein